MGRKVCGVGINDMRGYSNKENSIINYKIYKIWCSMIWRVYDNRQLLYRPTYIGCSIEESWLVLSNFVNDFKNLPGYSDFIKSNGKGYCLDKDIRVLGNKHYGPNTCSIVTESLNIIDSNRRMDYSKVASKLSRRVLAINVNDINDTLEFSSAVEAENSKYNFKSRSISACCHGKQKSHRGYYWSFL